MEYCGKDREQNERELGRWLEGCPDSGLNPSADTSPLGCPSP